MSAVEAKESKQKKNKNGEGGLARKLGIMTRTPIILMGVIVTIASYFLFANTTSNEVNRNLCNVGEMLSIYIKDSSPGNIEVVKKDDGTYNLIKGDYEFSYLEGFLDEIKEATDTDVTVFFMDVRVATTLLDENGKRITYTVAARNISDPVINKKEELFFKGVPISGTEYYAFYMPLMDDKGEVRGMIFVGKPSKEVRTETLVAAMWLPIITIIIMILASWFSSLRAKEIVDAITKEKKFLDEIANGNLTADLDMALIKRNDEVGDMARFSRTVQKFIREMIERDTLTRLYTRRIGETKIAYVQKQLEEAGVKFCVGMADIDFFKKFNDTYGHDCGDIVLKEVARIFNEMMIGHGFAVRWGGEEFLIIFEGAEIEGAYEYLKKIRQAVLDKVIDYKGEQLGVTMTFGLVEGGNKHIDTYVKDADNLLYFGKQNGRNCIVIPSDLNNVQSVEIEN